MRVAEGARGLTARTAVKKGKPRGSALRFMRNIGLAVASSVSKPRAIADKRAVKCCL